MNYCIIMPRLARDNNASYAFPVGMAYVSASLKATGRNVVTYNMNYKSLSTEEIIKRLIEKYDLDVIASGGLTTQYPELYEIFKIAKQIKPEIITWVGGGIITASPIPAMEALEFADYGMIGEGEITICELAEAMEKMRSVESVNGIIFRDTNRRWILTSAREEIQNLDTLPLPDYEGFDYVDLLNKVNFELNAEHSGMVAFSRSCPFNCTFCFHPSGTKYRKRSLNNILNEVDYLIKTYSIKSLFISDELFALRNEEFTQFCNEIKKRQLTFFISLRVDMVNKEIIHLLKESGCIFAGFGLESADNTILKSMNKHITVEQIEHALSLCYDENLQAQGNFIFGDEMETVDTYQNTLRWWKDHPKFNIKLASIIVYPGSVLYKNALKNGIIKDEVQYIKDGCPQINVSKLTSNEYRQMMLDISIAFQKQTEQLINCKITYEGSGLGEVEGECPHCHHFNVWRNREIFRPVRKLVCEHCGKIIDSYPGAYIDKNRFIENFKALSMYKVGLWGAVNSLEGIFEYVPQIFEEPFSLIDSSRQKQGLTIHGKIIESPEIISDKLLDLIVITFTSTAAGTIYRTIQEKYPSVKKIIYLGDLLDPDFLAKLSL